MLWRFLISYLLGSITLIVKINHIKLTNLCGLFCNLREACNEMDLFKWTFYYRVFDKCELE